MQQQLDVHADGGELDLRDVRDLPVPRRARPRSADQWGSVWGAGPSAPSFPFPLLLAPRPATLAPARRSLAALCHISAALNTLSGLHAAQVSRAATTSPATRAHATPSACSTTPTGFASSCAHATRPPPSRLRFAKALALSELPWLSVCAATTSLRAQACQGPQARAPVHRRRLGVRAMMRTVAGSKILVR